MRDVPTELARNIEGAEQLGTEFGRGMASAFREALELIAPNAPEATQGLGEAFTTATGRPARRTPKHAI